MKRKISSAEDLNTLDKSWQYSAAMLPRTLYTENKHKDARINLSRGYRQGYSDCEEKSVPIEDFAQVVSMLQAMVDLADRAWGNAVVGRPIRNNAAQLLKSVAHLLPTT